MRAKDNNKKLVLTRLTLATIKALDAAKRDTGLPKERMIEAAVRTYLADQKAAEVNRR